MKKHPYRYWIIARRIVQYLSLLLFLVVFLLVPSRDKADPLLNVFFRFDPLVALARTIASREIIQPLIAGLVVLGLSLFVGRAWCGWICPLGTLLDIFQLRKKEKKPGPNYRKLPEKLRSIKYIVIMILLFSAVLGNLTLLVLDPLTILMRSLTTAILPAVDQITRVAEANLYRLPLLSDWVTSFDRIIRPALLPSQPIYPREALPGIALLAGIILLNLASPRFWCRYLCPLGGLLGLLSKFSLLRREVSPDCKNCQLCSSACPTGTIDPSKGFESDPAECTLCLDCLESCPRTSISFKAKWASVKWNPEYDPSRRQAIGSLLTATAAIALFRSDWRRFQPPAFLLLPPGAQENTLLSQCVRCGMCIRACPTGALSPASQEFGIESLWTPIVTPRLGYCEYSCKNCSDVCPTHAIPLMTIEEKRQQVIGKAYIDQNRCLAWSDHIDCIVCEEMCPLPQKAIFLEETPITDENGSTRLIQLPHVQRDRCIGCGVCEYKCPLVGEAAIRVRTT